MKMKGSLKIEIFTIFALATSSLVLAAENREEKDGFRINERDPGSAVLHTTAGVAQMAVGKKLLKAAVGPRFAVQLQEEHVRRSVASLEQAKKLMTPEEKKVALDRANRGLQIARSRAQHSNFHDMAFNGEFDKYRAQVIEVSNRPVASKEIIRLNRTLADLNLKVAKKDLVSAQAMLPNRSEKTVKAVSGLGGVILLANGAMELSQLFNGMPENDSIFPIRNVLPKSAK
jgi:hypothetical protein